MNETAYTVKGRENKVYIPTVNQFMTETVFTVKETDTILIADEVLNWKKIRHVPVIDENNSVVGLLTHRDILKASIKDLSDNRILVSDIMSRKVKTVKPDTWLCDAAKLMIQNKYGCLPVVNGNQLVGIITESDFVKAFLEWDISLREAKGVDELLS